MIRDCRQDIMDPQLHALDNLEHAHWRVNFVRHLLQAHLASPWKGTREWQAQHADFLHQLAAAEDELAICKKTPAIIQKIVEGNAGDRTDQDQVSPHSFERQEHRQHESEPVTKTDSP